MKLDRTTTPGRGKYALIKLRQSKLQPADIEAQERDGELFVGVEVKAVDFGNTPGTDFFVIRLKDRFAAPALRAYARAVDRHFQKLAPEDRMRAELLEYHKEIVRLAELADLHPNRRLPD